MSIREAFQEELRQRSQVAACARYRRGRRRGCSLPSDSLSPAQLRGRNGPVRVFRGGVEVVTAAEDGVENKTDKGENKTDKGENKTDKGENKTDRVENKADGVGNKTDREKMNIADREEENA